MQLYVALNSQRSACPHLRVLFKGFLPQHPAILPLHSLIFSGILSQDWQYSYHSHNYTMLPEKDFFPSVWACVIESSYIVQRRLTLNSRSYCISFLEGKDYRQVLDLVLYFKLMFWNCICICISPHSWRRVLCSSTKAKQFININTTIPFVQFLESSTEGMQMSDIFRTFMNNWSEFFCLEENVLEWSYVTYEGCCQVKPSYMIGSMSTRHWLNAVPNGLEFFLLFVIHEGVCIHQRAHAASGNTLGERQNPATLCKTTCSTVMGMIC